MTREASVERSGPSVGSPPDGAVLFARYAYGPNRLGYCGTDDHDAVLGHAATNGTGELRELARTFDGAYPYLELIASANGIADPLDRRVVEAYWLGNTLTAQVKARALQRRAEDGFRPRMARGPWRELEGSVEAGAAPVHAFHVLDVFPRTGLLRGGPVEDVLAVIDACRIRWGRVRDVADGQLVVDVVPLVQQDGRLTLGTARPEVVERWVDGVGFVDDVRPGELVSVHWGWACDRLSARQAANLAASTRRELRIANEAL
jgi:hypothetical protein